MHTVDPDSLETFAQIAIEECGSPAETAAIVARSLVSADLVGHSSHGVVRLPYYANQIDEGSLDPTALPSVEEAGLFHQIDGAGAFGQVTGRRAVELVTETAAEYGVGVVGISDSGHLGRIGEWADYVADEGYLFASWVNLQGGAQRIAPPGTADRRLGTNPITFAVPSFGVLPFNLLYDGATSQVAHGKIIERDGSGERLPTDWTITETGGPVEYATDFEDHVGALLPLGGKATGHKGFGLATMTELFAAIVGGGPVSTEPEQSWVGNGAAFVAIDPTVFTSREGVKDRISALSQYLRSAEPIEADGEVLLPGEPEYRIARDRREAGIPIEDAVIENLQAFADNLGIRQAFPETL
ncbi:Ldh family oxidoreductase [Halorubrum sp. AD140]|uniref:Ldh family oxidoreductase n=1 Tax=Halorubrum sp. AD140 TaxID=3050073 RepID=UPI002ACCFEBA|nr:Ldh family oxidoreductase [Halorubrum sp. AD140]MDZ5811405.1 Ldh family oxidoreductase [Halorubrum sp. AD140]